MKDLFNVEGKIVLVTGGSRGIGEMIAEGFVQNGAKVYITARKKEACEATADRLSKIGFCEAVPGDLAKSEDIDMLAKYLGEREKQLDVLINNAGAVWAAPIDEFPEDGWDKVVDVNLKSVFFLTQKLLPCCATPQPLRILRA